MVNWHYNNIISPKLHIALNMFSVAVVCGVLCTGAHAATDGCDKEENDRISAELALCDVHAYNAGWVKNPDNEADRQFMREIIALKTTVIAQQMDKQYEYMDAMLRRFKTQLEKAVLTTKIQTAKAADGTDGGVSGGGSYSGGTTSGGSSGNRKSGLADAGECAKQWDVPSRITCLRGNIELMESATDSGNLSDVRQQISTDKSVIESMCSQLGIEECKNKDAVNYTMKNCNGVAGNSRKVKDCLSEMRNAVININYKYEQANKQPANNNR